MQLHSYIYSVLDDNGLGILVNLSVSSPSHSETGNAVNREIGICEHLDQYITKLLSGHSCYIKSAILSCIELKSCGDGLSTIISVCSKL